MLFSDKHTSVKGGYRLRKYKDIRLSEGFIVDFNAIPKNINNPFKILHFEKMDKFFQKFCEFESHLNHSANQAALSVGVIAKKSSKSGELCEFGSAFIVGYGTGKYHAFILSCAHIVREGPPSLSELHSGSISRYSLHEYEYFFFLPQGNQIDHILRNEPFKENGMSLIYTLEVIYGCDNMRSSNFHVHPTNPNLIHEIAGDIVLFGVTGYIQVRLKTPPFWKQSPRPKQFIPTNFPDSDLSFSDSSKKIASNNDAKKEEYGLIGLFKDPVEGYYSYEEYVPHCLATSFMSQMKNIITQKLFSDSYVNVSIEFKKIVNNIIEKIVNASPSHLDREIALSKGNIVAHEIGKLAIINAQSSKGMSGSPLISMKSCSHSPVVYCYGMLVGGCPLFQKRVKYIDAYYQVLRKQNIDWEKDEDLKEFSFYQNQQLILEKLVHLTNKEDPVGKFEDACSGNAILTTYDKAFISVYQVLLDLMDLHSLSTEEQSAVKQYCMNVKILM